MTRHYHIITCDSTEQLEEFITRRQVGIRPVSAKTVNASVRMNWDILADIARVKAGDHIFLHTSGMIKGVFEVTDNPFVDPSDTGLFDGPNINTANWVENWEEIENTTGEMAYVWWIPVRPVPELCFREMGMDVVFDRIAKGEITSLPQRLRYEDKNKTVKGVTSQDFAKIIRLLRNYTLPINPQTSNLASASKKVPITFDFLTDDIYEKNLEALIVHRVRCQTLEIRNHPNFYQSNVLNTVPLGYLRMADLLTWNNFDGDTINPWVWELKTGSFQRFDEFQEEIRKVSVRASFVDRLLTNGYKLTGVVLSGGFSSDSLDDFKKMTLPIGPLEEVILITFDGTGNNVSFGSIARKC